MTYLTKRNKRLIKQIIAFLLIIAILTLIISSIPNEWSELATALALIFSAAAAIFLDVTSEEPRNRLRYWNRERLKKDEDPDVSVRLSFNYSLEVPVRRGEISNEISSSLGVHSVNGERFTTSRDTIYGKINKKISLDDSGFATGSDDSDVSLFSDGGSISQSASNPDEPMITNVRGSLNGETTYSKVKDMITTMYTEEREILSALSPYRATTVGKYSITCDLTDEANLDTEGMCYLLEPEGIQAWTDTYEVHIEGNTIKIENLKTEELAQVQKFIYQLITFYG